MNYKEITTWEQVAEAAGVDPNAVPDLTIIPERLHKFLIANYKVALIAEVLNKAAAASLEEPQWKPDWNNYRQDKYTPWFEVDASDDVPSGFGFSHTAYVYTDTRTNVGSRLLFRSSQLAIYAGKTFPEIYKDLILMD